MSHVPQANQIKEKLDGMPELYYINLDNRLDKRSYMEQLFLTHHIKGTRISATHIGNYTELIEGAIPTRLRPAEIATSISHLRAIKYWYDHSEEDMAMICEDDLSFETVSMWNTTWKTVVSRLPFYWEIFQCSLTYHPQQPVAISLHHHQTYDFSCVCYVIKRSYAKRLLELYERNGKWKLDYPTAFPLTAEELLYRPGACVSLPLFCYTNQFESSIQTKEHMMTFHEYSRNIVLQVWKQVGNHDLLQMHPPLFMETKKY